MTTTHTQETPPGATLHIGGTAYASPSLEPLLIPISEAHPYPGNPRRHDQDGITSSIRDHGLYASVVLQATTGHVIVGNGRLAALLELGADRVPVTLMDVPDDRAALIVARDNRTSDLSINDDGLLLALLQPYADDGELLALAGYGVTDLDDLTRNLANLAFAEDAANAAAGTPAEELAPPIDIDADALRVTVTVDADAKAQLYKLLSGKTWVRDVADAHTRKP